MSATAADRIDGYLSPVNYLTLGKPCRWQLRTRGAIDTARWNMQMQQIRYFLALCEERNFTRAAKRCGVSQPSLTNAIIALEQELGGTLFQRKPLVSLTMLGHAVHPYFDRIAQNADHAREAAQAMADVRRSSPMPLQPSRLRVDHNAVIRHVIGTTVSEIGGPSCRVEER
jgi:hypothetical protein